MSAEKLLFAMLRSVICGWNVTDEVKNACTPELLQKTFVLAQKHDLGHLVGQAAADWKLPECETVAAAKQTAMQAFYRYMRTEHVYVRLCKTLEEAQIPFIPLKGSVLRESYPQPWMRTSCDIDVLVPMKQLEKAAGVLSDKLSYRRGGKGDHDISFYAPENVHVELHYQAVDEGRFPEAQELLKEIWDYASPLKGYTYHCLLSDAMFYFYHIAHMAKHLENGGCGIRPFLDLWIMDHRIQEDVAQRDEMLLQGGMMRFAKAARGVSEAWLSGEALCAEDAVFEQFVLTGGVYGTLEAQVAVAQTQKGGKLRFVLGKIFLPYEEMKYYYPVVASHRWLMPFCQVRRWFRILFCGGVRRSVDQLKTNAGRSKSEMKTTEDMLKYLGL